MIVVEPAAELPRRAARWLADTIAGLLGAHARCSLALAGGSTPRPVYAALAEPEVASRVDWARVEVFFGDERAVPPHAADSNFRMTTEVLFSHVPLPPTQVHRIEGERRDLEAAAADYDRALPGALDVLILGMGADGHTASLFPGSPALEEHRRVVVVHSPKPPPLRLSITPPVIAAARVVCMLVTGTEKAAMVARALRGDATPSEVPAVLARHGVWFLDPPAASRLVPPVA